MLTDSCPNRTTLGIGLQCARAREVSHVGANLVVWRCDATRRNVRAVESHSSHAKHRTQPRITAKAR